MDLANVEEYGESISQDKVFLATREELKKFKTYVVFQKNQINVNMVKIDSMKPSEIRIAYLYNVNNNQELTDDTKMRHVLKSSSFTKLSDLLRVENDISRLSDSLALSIVSMRAKISILNKGSNDGLVRNEGKLLLANKEYKIERIPPPVSDGVYNAIPTYNVNPNTDFLFSNSVGRIEKSTMVDFWYKVLPIDDTSICTDLCIAKYYEIVLYNQNYSEIKKKEKCTLK